RMRRSPTSPLFPYTTLFRSNLVMLTLSLSRAISSGSAFPLKGIFSGPPYAHVEQKGVPRPACAGGTENGPCDRIWTRLRYPCRPDRKSTRLNSSHVKSSYAV